ncbi:MAG: hypothetical protein KDD65_09900 [Bacteroidetes bacterium]|nr:hypothetical protein [Bacteroidota bacterium]
MAKDRTFLIFGGSGLVGTQIVREISRQLKPEKIIIAGLVEGEVTGFLETVRREFPSIVFDGVWGNIFVRDDFSAMSRTELLATNDNRDALFEDLYGDLEDAFARSRLAQVIIEHRPDVLIDCINTATGISYQDVFSLSRKTQDKLAELGEGRYDIASSDGLGGLVETLLISQSTVQLIRHIMLLHMALRKAETRLYLKVGTTGTGGMGLNIPYTHSEDKPSVQLMAKTAMAFAHTGLLFLMARTPDGPLVKELKPAAMIGYRRVNHQVVRRGGKPQTRFDSRVEPLSDRLELRSRPDSYDSLGDLAMAGVDTGENGFFARGEFETITYLDQMEFVTPEEIAQHVVLEIKGSNTGLDVIAGVDSNVISPSYRAGVLRHTALEKLARIEHETNSHSVAVGQLGPPELSKLLFESYLLKLTFGTLQNVIDASPSEIGKALLSHVNQDDELRSSIVSIGVPILSPDGKSLLRGPQINIPESIYDSVGVSLGDVDQWAHKGWVDLREPNMRVWQKRFEEMKASRHMLHTEGTASISRETYLTETIEIGAVVAWIFNNEEKGYRIK